MIGWFWSTGLGYGSGSSDEDSDDSGDSDSSDEGVKKPVASSTEKKDKIFSDEDSGAFTSFTSLHLCCQWLTRLRLELVKGSSLVPQQRIYSDFCDFAAVCWLGVTLSAILYYVHILFDPHK